ncbi:hypothetical protein B1A85_07310 [Chroococcidiopsis sp. TS-821]|nr:hypothetical protein B1A85_07310 [Chroococcidiopsis sp. TS-821]
MLLPHLQVALNLYLLSYKLTLQPQLNVSWCQKKDGEFTYVWAIALQLSTAQKIPAIQIATKIIGMINTQAIADDIRQKLATENLACSTLIAIRATPSGLIYLELTDCAIAAWLQYSIANPPKIEKYCLQKNKTLLPFILQYTHARCYSVLQLAAREGIIPPVLTSISFLDSQQQLLCRHAAEQALIKQLLVTSDNLYAPNAHLKPHWQKIAVALCQSWQTFYAYCQIWGEVKRNNLDLARVRLGLTLLTQRLLAVLLNDKLGIYAPTEL